MKNDRVQSSERPSRWQAIREFLYGMFGMEIASHAMEMRASLESLFMLGTMGDMLAVLQPSSIALRCSSYRNLETSRFAPTRIQR